jgi:hypothetical protein
VDSLGSTSAGRMANRTFDPSDAAGHGGILQL